MSVAFKLAIENIRELSTSEKALMAHCLISSLELKQEEDVDDTWAQLAEKRYIDLESGAVDGLSWLEFKKAVID